MTKVRFKHFQVALLALLLSACASVPDSLIDSPRVRLSNVHVVGVGFDSQTFLLSFDVANPNPFPLPIRGYKVEKPGCRFFPSLE